MHNCIVAGVNRVKDVLDSHEQRLVELEKPKRFRSKCQFYSSVLPVMLILVSLKIFVWYITLTIITYTYLLLPTDIYRSSWTFLRDFRKNCQLFWLLRFAFSLYHFCTFLTFRRSLFSSFSPFTDYNGALLSFWNVF